MKLVIFNNKHKLDIPHEVLYYDHTDLTRLDDVYKAIASFSPDLFIEEEKNDGVSQFNAIYEKFPSVKKAWWMIDAHCNLIDHIVYAKQFDYIFAAQSWFMRIVRREVAGQVYYLPLCHTQTLKEYRESLKHLPEKDIDFSFVGNIRSIHVDRKRHIAYFLKKNPNMIAMQAPYNDMLILLQRSYVTYNCSLNNDLNFRVWEALACGTNILTDYVTDLDTIKGLRERIMLYDKLSPDWHALVAPENPVKIDYILSNHTLTHRMNQMIEMIQKGKQYAY